MRNLVIYGFASAFALAMPAFSDSADGYSHSHMMGTHGTEGLGMFLGLIFMLVLLAALVVGVVVPIRWTVPGTVENNALNALNLRFANGEIDAKEYADPKN